MTFKRFPQRDPRTIAREIPGIFEGIFPQLTPGLVAYLNKQRGFSFDGIERVSDERVRESSLQHAMLFEIAFARAEQIIQGDVEPDWEGCLKVAVFRQRRHFDARLPDSLTEADVAVAEWVASNLAKMLDRLRAEDFDEPLEINPPIPGYQWLSSSHGDFALGSKLIEVKASNRAFGSADYRQILMYWVLSYAAAIESGLAEWTHGVLLNPRKNRVVLVPFEYLINSATGGRSKVEVLELFAATVGDHAAKMHREFRL